MKFESGWHDYWRKWRGTTAGSPPRVHSDEIFWSWLGSCIGIWVMGLLGSLHLSSEELPFLIGSFGASAVLLFGAPRSPLAQPRNLVGGHVISALVGVACWQLFHAWPVLAQALAVSSAIMLMHLTRTLHPPGGATALIAALGSPDVQRLGFSFVLMPVGAGALILLLVAVIFNNLPRTRRYPEYWL